MQTTPRPRSPSHPGDPDEHGRRPHPDASRELSLPRMALAGGALLQALQAVDVWLAGKPTGEPAPLAPEQRHALPELADTLDHLLRLAAQPGGPREDAGPALAAHCLRVALWAERERLPWTALSFAVHASDAAPADPEPAYHVGRLADAAGRRMAARPWLRWAVRHARKAPELLARTLLLLSHVTWPDNPDRALSQARRARLIARRARRHELEGDALRRMADLHFRAKRAEEAAQAALDAVDAYGPGHRRVEELAFAVATRWLEDVGDAEGANDLFVLLIGSADPARALLAAGCTARAAALHGRESLYETAAITATTLLGKAWPGPAPARALLHLARAAHTFGYDTRADVVARMAADRARQTNDHDAAQTAHDLLALLADPTLSPRAHDRLFPDLRHLPDTEDAEADAEERPRGPAAGALLARLRDALGAELRDANPGALRRVVAGRG